MGNNLKTTVFLLGSAVFVSLYAYRYERGPQDWEKPVRGVFTHLTRDDITEVELISGPAALEAESGSPPPSILLRSEVEREGELPQWRLVKPFSFPAFLPRVQGILRSIIELQRIKSVSPEEAEEFFGPDAVSMTVRFKTRQGEEFQIEIGREHPISDFHLVCVRKDGTEAFHTRQGFRRKLNASLDELRSRALFPVPKEKALRLHLQSAERGTLLLERREGEIDWRLGPPSHGTVDRGAIAEVLDHLNAWRVESFVTDNLEDPARYGFDRPRLAVALSDRFGQVWRYEVADDPRGELVKQVFVRDPDAPFVYAAKSEVLTYLEKPSEAFRSRFLLQLGAAAVVEVEGEARSSGQVKRFLLKKQPQSEEATGGRLKEEDSQKELWEVHDVRLDARYTADNSLASGFVRTLSALPVRRYLDSPDDDLRLAVGSTTPELNLNVRLDTGGEYALRFYSLAGVEGQPEYSYVVEREGMGEKEVALLPTSIPKDLSPGGIYFRKRHVSGFEFGDIRGLTILSFDGLSWRLASIDTVWRVGEDMSVRMRPDKSLNGQLVNEAVRVLTRKNFRVEAFLPDMDKNDKFRRGLVPGKSRLKLSLRSWQSTEGFKSITVGDRRDQSPGQEYYAELDSVEMPVLLANDTVKPLLDLVVHLREITERQ